MTVHDQGLGIRVFVAWRDVWIRFPCFVGKGGLAVFEDGDGFAAEMIASAVS
jgi:hypothetical protein